MSTSEDGGAPGGMNKSLSTSNIYKMSYQLNKSSNLIKDP